MTPQTGFAKKGLVTDTTKDADEVLDRGDGK